LLAGALGLPLWAGICVAITVFVLVIAAKTPMLSDIPAGVFGYASVVALALAGGKLGALTAGSLQNPLANIIISIVIGAGFGYLSEKGAGALVKK
jgi:Protein of unknown function (DUF1097)